MKRTLQTLTFVLITILLLPLIVPEVRFTEASGWLTGWQYRKSITISSTPGAGTNYPIKLTLHYGSGTDNPDTGDIYLSENCRPDFGDVRFTDNDGVTLIGYWRRTYVSGDSAEFWVKIPGNLSESNQQIYLYYGNPSATTTGSQKDVGIIQLREQRFRSDKSISISFSKTGSDELLIQSGASQFGIGWAFVVVNRTWLNGKYLRWNWKAQGYDTCPLSVYVYDGAYDYSSDSDFPDLSYWPVTKGAGRIQSLVTIRYGEEKTREFYLNLTSGTEDYCTIFFRLYDGVDTVTPYIYLRWLEINTGSGGSGNLWRYDFNNSVVMERTGTVKDYGLMRKYVSPEPSILEIGSKETEAPYIGEFQAPSLVQADTYFLLNATILAEASVSEFINATVELENGITLLWDAATDTFSEYQDTNGYCTLDASGSFKTQISSTSYNLSWRIKLSSSFPTGYVDIVDADVYSGTDHASNSEADLFYFTNYTGWWNTDWQKRKPIIITENSGSTLTDYQLAINVTYDADMQADFDDLRFTIYNSTVYNEVLLDYYLESKSDGSWAYIWVEILEILASSTATIYMYYGNPSAISESNASATFIFWDDFEQDRGWTYSENGGSFSGQYTTDQYHSESTSYKISYPSGTGSSAGYYGQIAKGITFDGSQVKIEVWVYDSYNGATDGYHIKKVKLGGTQLWSDDVAGDEGGWMHVSVATTPSAGTSNLILQVYEAKGVSNFAANVWWDDVKVRKYVSPEPSVTFGEEETGVSVSVSSFEAPSIVYADSYFLLNVTVSDTDGIADLDYVTVQIGTIVLKWDSSGDVFSEQSDPSGLCTLDAAGSFKTQLNSISYKLSFRIKLSSSFPSGYTDVSGSAYDSQGESITASQSSLFYFISYTDWWNTDWQKRKLIGVTENSGSTLTDYQVAINVTYDADMQSDFDDL